MIVELQHKTILRYLITRSASCVFFSSPCTSPLLDISLDQNIAINSHINGIQTQEARVHVLVLVL